MILALLVMPDSPRLSVSVAAEGFPKSSLEIVAGAERHRFRVEMAVTPEQHAQGLMWRRKLAADAGMLFDYGQVQLTMMWMKNTYIPLDMLFIAGDGTIVNIARNTEPLSLKAIPSAGPVRGVLEVPAGTVERLGIKAGDRVRHPIFR